METRVLKSKTSGFTLVELLVVISIIALLLAILMPSLQKARDQAKGLICMSNIKTSSMACLTYTADNSDYFPVSYSANDLRLGSFAVKKFPSADHAYPWQFYMWSYHKNFGVYTCPLYPFSLAAEPLNAFVVWRTDIFPLGKYVYKTRDGFPNYLHGNIGYNNFIGGCQLSSRPYQSKKASSVPSRIGLFGDSWIRHQVLDLITPRLYGGVHILGDGSWLGNPDARHGGNVNVGFVDGSVSKVEEKLACWFIPNAGRGTIWYFNP